MVRIAGLKNEIEVHMVASLDTDFSRIFAPEKPSYVSSEGESNDEDKPHRDIGE